MQIADSGRNGLLGKLAHATRAMPANPHNALISTFAESRPLYEDFVNSVRDLICTLLHDAGIRVDAIQNRVKTEESLSEKLNRPGKSYSELEDVPDLGGLRVIVYHQEDVDRVVEVIEREFDVDGEESGDAAAKLAPHEFGYLSVHLVIRLSSDRQQLTEWCRFKTLHAEVQVRTALQHAWASISHALQYKNEDEVPHALRRRLYRLAGLLELADAEFATLNREHIKLAASADLETENVLMILQKVLGKRRHSYDWIRDHAPLAFTDEEFDKLIRDHPDILQSQRIVRRDKSGKRIKPGKLGMKIKMRASEDS